MLPWWLADKHHLAAKQQSGTPPGHFLKMKEEAALACIGLNF